MRWGERTQRALCSGSLVRSGRNRVLTVEYVSLGCKDLGEHLRLLDDNKGVNEMDLKAKTDRLTEHFKRALSRESMADENLHEKLSGRVLNGKWQTLPYTTEVIDGVEQGAHSTYWVNPAGRLVFIAHASHYNWREDGKFIASGPWLQVSKDGISTVFQNERIRAEVAEENARKAKEELETLKSKMKDLLGIEEEQ